MPCGPLWAGSALGEDDDACLAAPHSLRTLLQRRSPSQPADGLGSGAPTAVPSIESARYWARSCTCNRLSAPLAEIPSRNIVRQKGQAVATRGASVLSACSTRSWLMRFPIFSSIHIRPPPAPQQKPRL